MGLGGNNAREPFVVTKFLWAYDWIEEQIRILYVCQVIVVKDWSVNMDGKLHHFRSYVNNNMQCI